MPVIASLGDLFQRGIVDAGKLPELLLLVAFLASFAFIRTSAHLIRANVSWWPGNVEVGGTHIHHLVWGIVALLVFGYIGLALAPPAPWREIVAVLFGFGAGLTLDEFALWLNLRDVYWSEEGRRSIDAVIFAGALGLVVLLGIRVWVDLADEVATVTRAGVAAIGVLGVGLTLGSLAAVALRTQRQKRGGGDGDPRDPVRDDGGRALVGEAEGDRGDRQEKAAEDDRGECAAQPESDERQG